MYWNEHVSQNHKTPGSGLQWNCYSCREGCGETESRRSRCFMLPHYCILKRL
uniref:Uncharacterized protein n=1 Tax=Anguilla anguilla TaxID=7936 RepID=A0A0E9V8F7_ANGAN